MSKVKLINSYADKGEVIISHEKELMDAIDESIIYGNNTIILDSMGFGSLTLGIGNPYGFAEFIKDNGETPYLTTCHHGYDADDGAYIEFDSGGTPTPIPYKNCLPISTILEIARFFFEKKELPDTVTWVEE